MPHIIRIRGPWQREVIEVAAAGSATGDSGCVKVPVGNTKSVSMPAPWDEDLGRSFRGRVVYARHFNCPTSIDATTPIRMVFTKVVAGAARILLNDQPVGAFQWPTDEAVIDVTGQLQTRNEIRVELASLIDGANETGDIVTQVPAGFGLVGEVRLEIG